MSKLIHQPLAKIKPNRDPDFIIGTPEAPYMLRWWIIPRNETFNIYYHRVLRDDIDRALHDHPWPSFSIMVRGSVREITPDGTREIHQGECVYRDEHFSHRLELIDGPCETLFITGPKIREWGFHCPQGFVPWHEFVDQTNHGNVGRGCGEQLDAGDDE